MDSKEMLLNEIASDLAAEFGTEAVGSIVSRMTRILKSYTVEKVSTEIAIYDTETLFSVLKMFLVSKKLEGCSDRTLNAYKYENERALLWINKPIREVTTNDIRAYLAHKAFDDGVSESTQNNIRRYLSSFFEWMFEEEYIERNPVRKTKKVKEPHREKEALSEIEVEKIRSVIDNERDRALFEFLLSTGCRVGEAVRCNGKELKGDQITVLGKGNKERVVYLNAKAEYAVSEYLKTRTDDNEALFVRLRKPHDRLKISGAEIIIRNLGKKAGIKKVHPHRIRRTMATMAINRGMPLETIRQLLGHENMDTTLIYAKSTKQNVKHEHNKYL